MIEKRILQPQRVRKIEGSFAFLEHRFLREGFWSSLSRDQLLLYLLLVMVADRSGLSYYGYEKLGQLLAMDAGAIVAARNALIEKDLIAFASPLFQVLSLPRQPVRSPGKDLRSVGEPGERVPVAIHRVLQDLLR